jgi:hypothetical protein
MTITSETIASIYIIRRISTGKPKWFLRAWFAWLVLRDKADAITREER